MAEDLVRERRQVLELRRENRRLRDELARLKEMQEEPARSAPAVPGHKR